MDVPRWAKQIEIFKRDENNNKRQIAGPRNYVSEAKTYKFTRGFHHRGNNRGFNGNQRGNDFRRPRDYNRYNQNRQMVPVSEMQDEIAEAKRMERYIQLAGEHARDERTYDEDGYSERSNLSFTGKKSNEGSLCGDMRITKPDGQDSLEFDDDNIINDPPKLPESATKETGNNEEE
jgi:hypothetical protein